MDLNVIIPVYNEEEVIKDVVESWVNDLDSCGMTYKIKVYNDGSKDGTLNTLNQLKEKIGPKLEVIDKKNSGHGPTILMGYRSANSDWVFQVDSDNEMESKHFAKLWNMRDNFDLVLGSRKNRETPLSRKIITFVSYLTVRLIYGKGIKDINSPYRLYRKSRFEEIFRKIPENTFAPNVILSGYACLKKYRIAQIEIPYIQRQTGEVSIKKLKLLKAAIKSWIQTVAFRFRIATLPSARPVLQNYDERYSQAKTK